MTKVGLVGGIGPASTVEYYRLIIEEFRRRGNTDHYPEFHLHSIDMTEMLSYVFSGELKALVDFLLERLRPLEKLGIEVALLASNTPHLVFDELQAKTELRLISIVEESCKQMESLGLNRAGLLGTKSTMSAGFYQKKASRLGIELFAPSEKDQDYVHDKYMGELVFNTLLPETKNGLLGVVERLKEGHQIQGLVLGGTELPLILSQSDFDDLHVLNTTEIHVRALVDELLKELP